MEKDHLERWLEFTNEDIEKIEEEITNNKKTKERAVSFYQFCYHKLKEWLENETIDAETRKLLVYELEDIEHHINSWDKKLQRLIEEKKVHEFIKKSILKELENN